LAQAPPAEGASSLLGLRFSKIMALSCFLICLLPILPQFAAHDLPVVQLSLAPPPNQNPELALLIGKLEEKREQIEEGAMGSLEKQLRTSLVSLQQRIKAVVAEAAAALQLAPPRPSFLAKEQGVQGEKLHVRVAVRTSKAVVPDSDMQQQILELERKREIHERSFLGEQSFQARLEKLSSLVLKELRGALQTSGRSMSAKPAAFLAKASFPPQANVEVQTAEGWRTPSEEVQAMEDRRVISEGLAAATLLDAEVRFVNEANRVIEEELSSALAYEAA